MYYIIIFYVQVVDWALTKHTSVLSFGWGTHFSQAQDIHMSHVNSHSDRCCFSFFPVTLHVESLGHPVALHQPRLLLQRLKEVRGSWAALSWAKGCHRERNHPKTVLNGPLFCLLYIHVERGTLLTINKKTWISCAQDRWLVFWSNPLPRRENMTWKISVGFPSYSENLRNKLETAGKIP